MHLLSCSQVTPTKTMKYWLCYVHGLLSYKALSMLYGNSTTTLKLTREDEMIFTRKKAFVMKERFPKNEVRKLKHSNYRCTNIRRKGKYQKLKDTDKENLKINCIHYDYLTTRVIVQTIKTCQNSSVEGMMDEITSQALTYI